MSFTTIQNCSLSIKILNYRRAKHFITLCPEHSSALQFLAPIQSYCNLVKLKIFSLLKTEIEDQTLHVTVAKN